MKTIRTLMLSISVGLFSTQVIAQDYTDALRYSYLSPQGTARSMGFGNALGSIGGDFTSLSVNPAGIGIYRSSEITFSPSLKMNSTDGQYQGNTSSNNNTRFNINNIGIVFTNAKKGRRYERSKWKSVSFGIGMNRLADYNRDYSYSGNNNTSSGTQVFVANANYNNVPPDYQQIGSLGDYGYQSYLINYDSSRGANPYYSIVDPTKGLKQTRTVTERGGINELVFTLGGNYEEKLMLGATLGVPIINYSRYSTYSESSNTVGTDFTNYSFNENLTTTGSGINLKLGAIYKITNAFRIGAAIHTPTYYTMHDEDDVNLYSTVQSSPLINNALGPVHNTFDYNLTTPWRGILSASAILGTVGFITADYEYVDYSTARFNYDPQYSADQIAVNDEIRNNYKAASNLRIGAEVRVTSIFMLRAGFGYYGNPYQQSYGIDGSSISFSGGLGFRFTHFFIDAAYTHVQYKNPELPYAQTDPNIAVPVASIQSSLNNAVITVGFKF